MILRRLGAWGLWLLVQGLCDHASDCVGGDPPPAPAVSGAPHGFSESASLPGARAAYSGARALSFLLPASKARAGR